MQRATARPKKRATPTPPPEGQYFVPWPLDELEEQPTEPYPITERLPPAAPARMRALPAPAAPAASSAPTTRLVPPAIPEALRRLPLAQLVLIGVVALLLVGGGLWLATRGGPGKPAPQAAGAAPKGAPPVGNTAARAAAAPAGDLSAMSEADLLPTGIPITRTDWAISKDYAAHGGNDPVSREKWGAVDFAFWRNKDALGADLVATHAGTVKLLEDDPTYGNLVYVMGPRYTTTYGHMQKFNVKEGQIVRRGDRIGFMGSTGQSTGPHVDYQVWKDGKNQNPMDYCQCGMQGSPEPPR